MRSRVRLALLDFEQLGLAFWVFRVAWNRAYSLRGVKYTSVYTMCKLILKTKQLPFRGYLRVTMYHHLEFVSKISLHMLLLEILLLDHYIVFDLKLF